MEIMEQSMSPNLMQQVFQKKIGEKWREKKFIENSPAQDRGGASSKSRKRPEGGTKGNKTLYPEGNILVKCWNLKSSQEGKAAQAT